MTNDKKIIDIGEVLSTGQGLKEYLIIRDATDFLEQWEGETLGLGLGVGSAKLVTEDFIKDSIGIAADARDIDNGLHIGLVVCDVTGGTTAALLSAPFEGMESGENLAEEEIKKIYEAAGVGWVSPEALEFDRMMREVKGESAGESEEIISLKDIEKDLILEAAPYAYALREGAPEEEVMDEIIKRYGGKKIALKRFGEKEEVELWKLIYNTAKRAYLEYASREKGGEGETPKPGGYAVFGIPPVYYEGFVDKVMEEYGKLYNEDPEKAKKVAKYTVATLLAWGEAHKYSSIGKYSKSLKAIMRSGGRHKEIMEVLEG